MTELIIVSMAVTFILALLDPVVTLFSFLVSRVVLNTFFTLTLSAVGSLTLTLNLKHYFVNLFAIAFLSRFLLTVSGRIADYSPTIINQARD